MPKITTASIAEDYVHSYFKRHKNVGLIRVPVGELGYDFRDAAS
jgi:hypothetical protein